MATTAYDLVPQDGCRYRVTMRDNRKEETFLITVTYVELRDFGYYFGYIPDDWKYGKWGYARWEWEQTPYGLVYMEYIGKADNRGRAHQC